MSTIQTTLHRRIFFMNTVLEKKYGQQSMTRQRDARRNNFGTTVTMTEQVLNRICFFLATQFTGAVSSGMVLSLLVLEFNRGLIK